MSLVKRWGLLVLLVAVGLLAGGLSGGFWGEGVTANTWECREYNTDYSLKCMPRSDTECGRMCFYAVCVKCTDAYHPHTRCDAEGNCWTVMQRHGESPCEKWLWYLWDHPLEAHRRFETMTPNVQQAFMFGAVHPNEAKCWEGGGEFDILGLNDFVMDDELDPERDAEFKNRIEDTPPHEEAGHLADTLEVAGKRVASGALVPSLDDAVPVVGRERTYLLVYRAGGGVRVQYRVWPYSGFVPDDFGDPYADLPPGGEVKVEKEGLHTFQIRTVVGFGEGMAVQGISNVVNKVVGMYSPDAGVGLADGLYTPQPVATPWLLPPPPEGVERPESPVIRSVVEDPEVLGTVDVMMELPFVGRLEYRYWTHSGFPFTDLDGGWRGAPALVGGVFRVAMPRRAMQLGDDDPLLHGGFVGDPDLRFVKPDNWDFEHPAFYNFQTRVVTVVDSEPSNIVVVFVWEPPPVPE